MRPRRCSRSLRSTNSVTGSPTASEAPTRTPKSWNVQVSKKKDSESVKSQSAQKRPASLQSFGKAVSDVFCPSVQCSVKKLRIFDTNCCLFEENCSFQKFCSTNLKLARLLKKGIFRFLHDFSLSFTLQMIRDKISPQPSFVSVFSPKKAKEYSAFIGSLACQWHRLPTASQQTF